MFLKKSVILFQDCSFVLGNEKNSFLTGTSLSWIHGLPFIAQCLHAIIPFLEPFGMFKLSLIELIELIQIELIELIE